MATTKTLKTEKLTSTVGAEVLDVDLDRIREDEALPGAVMDALEENGVLVFKQLDMDDETQVAFCRKLGEIATFDGMKVPEIWVISLDPEVNPMADYLEATVYWHIDGTIDPAPAKATMLTAKVLSATGGETEFASTYAAYDDLSDAEKARYEKLRVFHSQVPIQSLVHPDPTPEKVAEWRARSREHPLVWTHQSGRKSLVIGQTVDYIVGQDHDEGRVVLDELNARATRPERVYRHEWSEGDTILWDNTGVVHRVQPYSKESRRELHRTTLVGEEAIQ
jgi:alpha-ketoglutarate-dependent taurine dioxygenase